MPLYVYQCPACGHVLEKIRPMAERDLGLYCPEYPEVPILMNRLASAPGHINVKGFAAVNGYSRTDTGWVSQGNGIKTRVSDATGGEK